jgi:hypothetical protein
MDYYNRKIADKLLSDQVRMIKHTEQPTMFNNELSSLDELHDTVYYGGAKPYKYILPGDTVATFEPSSLSVGTNPFETRPNHLIEVSSQPNKVVQGVNIRRKRGRPKKISGGNIFDTIGNVTKTIAPFAVPLMMAAAGLEKPKRRRPKKVEGGNFLGTLKSIGRKVVPVASQIGKKVILPVGQEVAKQALANYLTSGAGLKKRGRPKTQGGNFLKTMKSIGRTVAPVAKTIGNKVIMPVVTDVAKQALTNYLTKPSSGAGLKAKRGEMIKQVMSKHNLTLGAASKFIKENNLLK